MDTMINRERSRVLSRVRIFDLARLRFLLSNRFTRLKQEKVKKFGGNEIVKAIVELEGKGYVDKAVG